MENKGRKPHFLRNTCKLIGITLVVFIFLKIVLPMVLPFLVAFFIAASLNPLKRKMSGDGKWERNLPNSKMGKQNKKNGWRNLTCLVLLLGLVVLVGGILLLLLYLLLQQGKNLWESGQQWIFLVEDYLARVNIPVEKVIEQLLGAVEIAMEAMGGAVDIIVMLVAAFLILKNYDELHNRMMESAFGEVVLALGKDLKNAGGSYLKAQLCIMTMVILICVTGLFLTGNPYCLLVGTFIGICDALPFLGTAIVFVPWALVSFATGNVSHGLIYLALTGATAILRQSLEPKLIGDKIGANPLAVLASIYVGIQIFGVWGFLLGPVGAFLIWEIYRFT